MTADQDALHRYLDQLRASLRTPPPKTRRIVVEAEDHLRDTAAPDDDRSLGRGAGPAPPLGQPPSLGSAAAVLHRAPPP